MSEQDKAMAADLLTIPFLIGFFVMIVLLGTTALLIIKGCALLLRAAGVNFN